MISIRLIDERDVEDFRRVLDAVARERRYLGMLEAPPLEQLREFVLTGIAKENIVLVVEDGATMVGWCDTTRFERETLSHVGSLGMGLLPDYRGKGLGRRLISEALRIAWERGFLRVELTVYADNPRAFALYEQVGFVKEGVQRSRARIDGRFIDMWMMAILNGEAAKGAFQAGSDYTPS